MNINIDELKILFSTNIKSKEKKTIEFKFSMLHHPELEDLDTQLNDYPYFTFDIKYPYSVIFKMPYKERVEFFFNREKFNDVLTLHGKEKNILNKSKLLSENKEAEYFLQRDKNIRKNVMNTLELLFPTQFPVMNDLQNSRDIVFDNTKINPINIDPMVPNYYSYLKVNGQTYTFKKVIWINDILNHPVYQELLIEYNKFYNWTVEEKSKQMIIINRFFNFLISLYSSDFRISL